MLHFTREEMKEYLEKLGYIVYLDFEIKEEIDPKYSTSYPSYNTYRFDLALTKRQKLPTTPYVNIQKVGLESVFNRELKKKLLSL